MVFPRTVLFVSIAIFRVVLDISYISFVNVLFEYSGFIIELKPMNYVLSWVIYLALLFLVDHKLSKVSNYFFMIALLGVVAPLTSYYGLSGRDVFPVMVTAISLLFIWFLVNGKIIVAIGLPTFLGGGKFAVGLSVFMVLLLVVWYFISGAVSYFNLDFSRVYEFRSLSAEASNVGFMAYVNGWVYQVFSIFLFSYCLLRNKFLLAFVVFLLQVFFFGVSAHKSVLFFPIMIVGIWYYFRKTNSMTIVPLTFIAVFCISLSAWYVAGNITLGSMFIRRVFFMPALLTYDYFSFFSDNEYIYWSNSVLSGFLNYPYHVRVANLIGEYNGSDAGANNGFISSGFAHAGLFGVFLYSLILGLLLRFVDVYSKDMPVWFALCIIIVPYRSALISSDLFTVLLTHGLLVAILLLLLVRPAKDAQNYNAVHC